MTSPQASDIILHHFENSPFSEKVRVMFGIKGASWGSVIIPSIMPKPDLIPLTGGYRRTPVMQIGADIFCDTQVMLAEIERHLPTPAAISGSDWGTNLWADRLFFQVAVPLIFGQVGKHVPPDFIKDREIMSGRPFDVAAMAAAVPVMSVQFRAHAAYIEDGLAGSAFLAGPRPGLADAAAYMNIWFLKRNLPDCAANLLTGLARTLDWIDRMEAIGHGARQEMAPAQALKIAADHSPAPAPAHDVHDPSGLSPGDPVFVMADDYARDQIHGRLVSVNPRSVTLLRADPAVGEVHVHFPRTGYILARS